MSTDMKDLRFITDLKDETDSIVSGWFNYLGELPDVGEELVLQKCLSYLKRQGNDKSVGEMMRSIEGKFKVAEVKEKEPLYRNQTTTYLVLVEPV